MTYKAVCVLALLSLSGCGSFPFNLINGGGPNVAANVQAGAENYQTVGKTATQNILQPASRTIEQSTGDTQVRTEVVETVVIYQFDWRYVLIIALLAGFLIPSPSEIARGIRGMYKGRSTTTA